MSVLAPEWAAGAHAIDTSADPHLEDGVHLRVATSPKLGLPQRPLIVYRIDLGPAAGGFAVETGVTWVDSQGHVLTAPFTVSPGNPVTGHLHVHLHRRCVWVEVLARPAAGGSGGGEEEEPGGGGPGGIRVDVFRHTALGRVYLGSRGAEPWSLGSSSIHGVVVSGSGTVDGIRWLSTDRLIDLERELWRLLSLPRESGKRYLGQGGDEGLAIDRVHLGAPRALGLHDEPGAPDPASTSPVGPGEEEQRVQLLGEHLAPALEALLDDLSAPPQDLIVPQPFSTGTGGVTGDASYSALGAVLLAAFDPGVGRWLGFVDRDEKPPAPPGSVVLYLVRGFWAIDDRDLSGAEQIALNAAAAGLVNFSNPPQDVPFDPPEPSVDGQPVYDFLLPAAVTLGAPPDSPAAPGVGAPLPPEPMTPDGLGPWLGSGVREVELPVFGLLPGASVAFGRDDGGPIVGLNQRLELGSGGVLPGGQPPPPDTRALALFLGQPDDATDPNTGVVRDRQAPPAFLTYRLAQADWFGRWSGWAFQNVAAKQRPGPPVPSFDLRYEIAALPTPVHSQNLWGRLEARVAVPAPATLPNGARPLDRVRLEGQLTVPDGTGGSTTFALLVEAALPTPATPELVVEIPVPLDGTSQPVAIPRAESATAEVTGEWIDTDSQVSPPSAPRRATLVDPRPPEQVVIDPTLRYSARPDATGRARVELSWTVPAGARRFRVYFCDETRLVERMEVAAGGGDAGAAAFLADHGAAATPAHRGQAFTDRPQLFAKEVFQNLTGEALEAAQGVSEVLFQHELSGSLGVLALYRVVALSASNVETDFATSPLVPFGVPNAGGPPRPQLEVVPRDAPLPPFTPPLADDEVRLRVRVVRGANPVASYRLRRSAVQSGDPRRMPVAREEAPTLETAADGTVTFEIRDAGGLPHDPAARLRSFTRYSWVVEVQAGDAPGSSVAGEWSASSTPAATMLVPAAPAAPAGLTIAGTGFGSSVVTLEWSHSEALPRGGLGGYRFDVYRRPPGAREERLGTVAVDADPLDGGRDVTGNFHFRDDWGGDPPASGTAYRVVAVDPIGRLSPPSAAVELS